MCSLYLDKILATNPTAVWPCQEASGPTATALPNVLFSGVYKGSWQYQQPGISPTNFSIKGDGATTGINAFTSAFTSAVGTWPEGTSAIWMKITNPADWNAGLSFSMMRSAASSSNANHLQEQWTGAFDVFSVSFVRSASGTNVSPTKSTGWTFIVFTWSESLNQFKVYQDGVQRYSGAMPGVFGEPGYLSLTLGARAAVTTVFGSFPGSICYPAIWTRPLTAPEVADLFIIPEPTMPTTSTVLSDLCWGGDEVNQLITPDGKVFSLDGVIDRTIMVPFNGQGAASSEFITQQGPQQHGRTVISYRLQPRVMQVVFRRQGLSRQHYWNLRSQILNMVRPNRQQSGSIPLPCKLRKILPDWTMRDIDVLLSEGLGFTPGDDWDEFAFQEGIRFIAHDPTFYDPHVQSVTASLSAIAGLSVPITVPLSFGSGTQVITTNIIYTGTWLSYPIITLTGPLTAAVISNLTTGESISFIRDLAPGQRAVIDTRFGIKTCVDPDLPITDPNYNLIGSVSGDLGTFHLDPDPAAPGGLNQIQTYITAEGTTGSMLLEYYLRYYGI